MLLKYITIHGNWSKWETKENVISLKIRNLFVHNDGRLKDINGNIRNKEYDIIKNEDFLFKKESLEV